LANRGLLQAGDLPVARPEKITSFEVGYKSILFDNKLVIDFDAYSNLYDGFLGQVQVFVPIGATIGTDASVLAMIDRNRDVTVATLTTAASKGQERYRVYTNAKNSYHSYGSTLGLTYNFYKKYTVSSNANYNNIASNAEADIFVTGFNTPKWTSNVSVGNREVIKNVGFNVTYRWQEAFLWESPLVTGKINAINNLDAQVNLRIPVYKATIKLGGTNVLNNRYIQYAGGPTIGGMYYMALTIDSL
jgi:iron complex outermembrane recepter protein